MIALSVAGHRVALVVTCRQVVPELAAFRALKAEVQQGGSRQGHS